MKIPIGNDKIVKTIVAIILPFILIFGIYVIINGHISPGGGFAGGVVIGGVLILYSAAFGIEETRKFFSFKTFTIFSGFALLFYGVVKGYSFVTGAAHIPLNIPLGTPGDILSAGLILPLNIGVGILVACIMYGLYALLFEGEI